MGRLPDFTRLLAVGLLNYADDHGFFWANSMMIRGSIFPFEEDAQKVRRGLEQLASIGYVRIGKSRDGREVGHVVNFSRYQRVDRAQDSEIQPIAVFDERSMNVQGTLLDESTLEGKGKEGKGKEVSLATGGAGRVAEKKPRPRNELMDTLAAVDGSDPLQVTSSAWSGIAKALQEIVTVSPEVTRAEIIRRAENYRLHYPSASISAHALAKHWALCDGAPSGSAPADLLSQELRKAW